VETSHAWSVGPRSEQQVDDRGSDDDDHVPRRISRIKVAESLES
jgi:hypothetical protein